MERTILLALTICDKDSIDYIETCSDTASIATRYAEFTIERVLRVLDLKENKECEKFNVYLALLCAIGDFCFYAPKSAWDLLLPKVAQISLKLMKQNMFVANDNESGIRAASTLLLIGLNPTNMNATVNHVCQPFVQEILPNFLQHIEECSYRATDMCSQLIVLVCKVSYQLIDPFVQPLLQYARSIDKTSTSAPQKQRLVALASAIICCKPIVQLTEVNQFRETCGSTISNGIFNVEADCATRFPVKFGKQYLSNCATQAFNSKWKQSAHHALCQVAQMDPQLVISQHSVPSISIICSFHSNSSLFAMWHSFAALQAIRNENEYEWRKQMQEVPESMELYYYYGRSVSLFTFNMAKMYCCDTVVLAM